MTGKVFKPFVFRIIIDIDAPDSEVALGRANNPKQRAELKNRLTNKMKNQPKPSGNNPQQRYQNKLRARPSKPEDTPRFRARPAPKPGM